MDLRHAEHARDLGVGMAFKEAEREDFRRPWTQGGERAPEAVPQLPLIAWPGWRVLKRHAGLFLPGAHDIEGGVDGRAAEIALGIGERLRRAVAPQEAEEDRLEHVFGVGGVACNTVRRPKDEPVAILEHPLDLAGDRGYFFLSDREFQGAPPVSVTTKDRERGPLLHGCQEFEGGLRVPERIQTPDRRRLGACPT